MQDVFTKGSLSAIIDINNKFVYRVTVNVQYKNVYCLAQTKYFQSDTEIKNYIAIVYLNKHITINCELWSAPKTWLDKNGFKLYIKPEKKKRIKKVNNGQETLSN